MGPATTERIRDQVRTELKRFLADNETFLAMPADRQLAMYKEMLDRGIEAAHRGLSRAMADDDLNPTRMQDVAGLAGDFLTEVNFTVFVRDLIKGVYDSIVQSTIQQMMAVAEYMKKLAEPLSSLARNISDADALGQVAASDPLRFTMGNDGEVTDNDSGMKLDTSSDEVQAMMFQAKLALAKERRLLLREMMLMGVQRLIVEKGTIKAGLVFNVTAREQFGGKKKSTDIKQESSGFGGGLFGLFGGGKENKETNITVSSRQLGTDTTLTAQLTGHVQVDFRSDVFNLNNFADLFGDESTKALVAQRQGAGPAAAPAAAPRA